MFAPRSVWTNQARTAQLTADLPVLPSRVDSLTTEIFRRHLFFPGPTPYVPNLHRSSDRSPASELCCAPALLAVICRAVLLLPDTDTQAVRPDGKETAPSRTPAIISISCRYNLASGHCELLIDCRAQSDYGDIATVLTACFLIRQLETKGLGRDHNGKETPNLAPQILPGVVQIFLTRK